MVDRFYPSAKYIVHGNKIICKLFYPTKYDEVPKEWEGCYKTFKPTKDWGAPDINLTKTQRKELYYTPSSFFSKNGLNLDLSTVNVDVKQYSIGLDNLKKIGDNMVNSLKQSFSDISDVPEKND